MFTRFLLIVVVILIFVETNYATDYFVRPTGGGSSSQCTGLADVIYDGSGSGEACAFSNPNDAITLATCGDIINIKSGETYDGLITLSNKSCTSSPITIQNTGYNFNPEVLVLPASASSMARIRLITTSGAFVDSSGGSYWRLRGLEITDNITESTGAILNLMNGGKTEIINCYIHPKESNPTWERDVFRGILYEGSGGLIVKSSYLSGFLGYVRGTTTLNATTAIASVGGKNVTLTNNFLSAWFAILFTGGGGNVTTTGHQTATFSGTPTINSATFSNTTGLAAGQIIRIDWLGTGTKSGSNFTQTSGTTLTNSDVVHGGGDDVAGVGVRFPESGFTLQVVEITAGNWTFLGTGINNIPSGDQPFELWQAVRVDSVVGSTVNFTPFGNAPLTRAPTTTNCRATWITDGIGDNAANWIIEKNNFFIDPEFADHQQQLAGNVPKGIVEFKHMVNLHVNGNRFTGYPSYWFQPTYSNDGSTPWSTTKDITFENNFFDFDLYPNGAHHVMDFTLQDPYHTATPGKNIIIRNNLARNVQGFSRGGGEGSDNVQIYHNTIINTVAGFSFDSTFTWSANTTNWVARDNIFSHRNFGAQCFFGGNTLNDCWPSGTWQNNVLVDTSSVGVTTSTWGSGSVLSPIITSFDSVGFINAAGGNYRLSGSSPYKNDATDGTDPGINQDALEAALSSTTIKKCNWHANPRCNQ